MKLTTTITTTITTIVTILGIALGTTVCAQTQLVRGKVEDVSGTNRFVLDCTSIPLVSTALNLSSLVGQQWNLQVVNTGTATSPVLDVRSATAATKIFDMGNLKIGSPERWQVNAQPGAMAAMFVNATAATSYLPFGAAGTWLLGPQAPLLAQGTVSGQGQLEVRFTMPNLPQLIGTSFSGQAIVLQSNQLILTNADCRDVRT